MAIQIVLRSLLGLAMSIVVCAQTPGRNPGTGGGTTTPTTTTPRLPTTTNTNTFPDIVRPMYISGRVMLDDGTPPGERANIQTVCSGNARTVGSTDSKGSFSVDLTNRNNAMLYSDASQSSLGLTDPSGMNTQTMGNTRNQSQQTQRGMSDRSFMGCDLQASLAGFRSDMVSLSNRRSLDNPDIGTIVLHRLANVEGVTISATSAMAPNDAKKAYEKGLNEARKEKWESAEKELWKAVDIYPKYASAWYHLGNVQQKQNNFDAARNSYTQSLAADARYVAPYQQLAEIYAKEKKWPQVVDATDRLLRLNPVEFPQAWYYNAVGNYQLRNIDAAEKSVRQTLAGDTAHHIAKAEYLFGLILASKHDLTGAAEHLRAYIKLAPDAPEIDKVKQQLAEMEQATSARATEKKPE